MTIPNYSIQCMSKDAKRLAHNTLALYFRTALTMLVSLYTSRVVLRELGETDFGIYNIVGGVVVLFSFLQAAMSTATQRFLSIELGKNDISGFNKVFNLSIICHIVIAIVVLIIGESIGLWLFETKLNIPPERKIASQWVYQFSLLTCLANIIRIPYNASIIAHEHMSFFALVGILEAILKLLIAYLLVVFHYDKLISYSILVFIVTGLITIIFVIFCKTRLRGCNFILYWDKKLLMKLISFSGWSLFGSVASVSASQGVNILLNVYFGVIINASMGIANQISSAVSTFSTNFQTAFVPQLMKAYASNNQDYFLLLINKTSKYSYFLLLLIGLPIIICCEPLLDIWLNDVPLFSVQFVRLIICSCMIDALSAPLWYSVQAIGNIKMYQMMVSAIIIINLPVSYIFLAYGFPPTSALFVRIALNVITHVFRIIYLKRKISLDIKKYLYNVIIPSLVCTFIVIPIPLISYRYIDSSNIYNVLLIILLTVLQSVILIYVFGLNKQEKSSVNNKLVAVISKFQSIT